MALIDDLVAYWPLGEASGNALDSHTNAITLTETSGTIGSLAGGGPGILAGNFRNFGGAADSEYFESTDNATLSMGDIDFTISAWVKLDVDPAGTTVIVSKGNLDAAGTNEYSLYYTGGATDNFFFACSNGTTFTAVEATNAGPMVVGNWYHVVGRHNAAGNQISIRVNNISETAVAHTGGAQDSTNAFRIGADTTARYWDGLIGHVAIWKRLLTDDDVRHLYNFGLGVSYADLDLEIEEFSADVASQIFSLDGKTDVTFKAWSPGGGTQTNLLDTGGGGGGCFAAGTIAEPFTENTLALDVTFGGTLADDFAQSLIIFYISAETGIVMPGGQRGEGGFAGVGASAAAISDDHGWVTSSFNGGNGAAAAIPVGGGGGSGGGATSNGNNAAGQTGGAAIQGGGAGGAGGAAATPGTNGSTPGGGAGGAGDGVVGNDTVGGDGFVIIYYRLSSSGGGGPMNGRWLPIGLSVVV